MAAIFSLIGFLGVLAGAAATAAGLYETFGDTQKAVDAWVSGAQVFFSGAMLMALGSVAARVRGTTRAIDDLAKAVASLRGETHAVPAQAPAERAGVDRAGVDRAGVDRAGGDRARAADRGSPEEADTDGPSVRSSRERGDDREGREPVLDRRPPRDADDTAAPVTAPPRRTRLGPALGEGAEFEPGPSRRSGRLRRSLAEE